MLCLADHMKQYDHHTKEAIRKPYTWLSEANWECLTWQNLHWREGRVA